MKMNSKRFGSDVILDVIKSLGVKYVTINPGSSIRGIHDSVVNYGGNQDPEMILCCHEEIAVSIASGYYRATNKPLVVLLHDLAGLLHAPRAILDAWQHRDGLIILGGNGPLRIENRRAGTDWNQVAESPNLVVRSYVKWDSFPYSLFSAVEAIVKGYAIAGTKPAGPIYISLDTDIQENPSDGKFEVPSLESCGPLELGAGDAEQLVDVASLLTNAENPVIVAGRYGKSNASVTDLVKLSEMVGAGVIDSGLRCNFPTNHPLNMTDNKGILSNADVVLSLDVRNLYGELAEEGSHYNRTEFEFLTKSDTKVIRIDAESVYLNSWITDSGRMVPVHSTINADGPAAVKALLKLCANEISKSGNHKKIGERKVRLSEKSRNQRGKWLAQGKTAMENSIINYPSLSLISWEMIKNNDWVITAAPVGIGPWLQRIWDITKWYQYPGTAGGTGCAIGRSIGVTLANDGKLCVNFQTDGDLLYSPSALWTIAHFKIPMLIMMVNNRSYYNDERHQHEMAVTRGRPVGNKHIGIKIEDPDVDFTHMAKTYGLEASGFVQDIPNLKKSIKQGIDVVMNKKRTYIVDVTVDMTK